MKVVMIGLVVAVSFLFSGCSTTYGTGKVIYKGAKTAYIELDLENENLERIDNVLVVYDEVRTSVVGEVLTQKKQSKVGADTSLTHE